MRIQGELTTTVEKDVVQMRTHQVLLEVFLALTSSLYVRNAIFSFLELFFKQVVVDGRVFSTVLRNLMSLTEYQIAVFAIYACHRLVKASGEPKLRCGIEFYPLLIVHSIVWRSAWLCWDTVLGHAVSAVCRRYVGRDGHKTPGMFGREKP